MRHLALALNCKPLACVHVNQKVPSSRRGRCRGASHRARPPAFAFAFAVSR